jgi:hypothetical protein
MNIVDVLKTINQMVADGLIQRYAIGGAVGATFYLEPVATLDVDIFVDFKMEYNDSLIVSLEPIYDYLIAHGGLIEGEYIVISEWPVQFLPPTGPLVEEALAQAVEKQVSGTSVRVFSAEHLAAIALQTGRAKDKARLLQFLETDILDKKHFRDILHRYNLDESWLLFEKQFLTDPI